MKQIKGILFDFNGTLFFDSDLHIKAFQHIFPMFGAPKPSKEYLAENVFGRTNTKICRDNINPNATDEEAADFARKKEAMYYELCLADKKRLKLVDGAEELLDYLKAEGIPYTIATGSDKEAVEFFFEHLGLEHWFNIDNMIYADGSFNGKPEPDCYLLAAEKIGLSASDCLVFEDGTSGIMSANAANAKGVVVVYDEGIPSPLREGLAVDAVYHDLKAWREILSQYEIQTNYKKL